MTTAAASGRQTTAHNARSRPRSSGDGSKGIWSSMLDNVSTGRRLSEKTLLILGGTVESQKNFLEALSNDKGQRRRPAERSKFRKPPIANRFALGYTYQDILDADQDDVLARLSQYLLADSNPAFSPLLQPLFTPNTIPDFAVVILLDWAEPWNWLRQLRDWIRTLQSALDAADDTTKDCMEENMKDWRQRRKGPQGETAANNDWETPLPVTLGPGEWDEPLGVPLCVVCQNAEKIEILERDHGWKESEFDTVLIYLRTVLLKHGASLIYTASSAPGSLQLLIRSALNVQSLLQQNLLRHNVNDRDKVLVPPNWDSWGKIRPLREGFDFEAVSNGWSIDIQSTGPSGSSFGEAQLGAEHTNGIGESPKQGGSAVTAFEEAIPNPNDRNESIIRPDADLGEGQGVQCPDNQEFFSRQLEILEQYNQEDEQAQKAKDSRKATSSPLPTVRDGPLAEGSRVSEHIGPVQFNMGGIQVDADEMLRSLREREAGRSSEAASSVASPEARSDNEHLRSFFASLASRGGSSAANSPR